MNARTYLSRALLFSLLTAVAVVAVNLVVDPYGIVGTPRIPGLSEYKVESNEHSRLMKKYQPLHAAYNTLIVGNSRVELGIRPSHPCFAKSHLAVYNLGMPGADVRTQLEYAMNLVHEQRIETVFLGIDFTDFISSAPQDVAHPTSFLELTTGEFRYTAAGSPNPDFAVQKARDYLKALFSLDALLASVKTVLMQSPAAPDRDLSGFNPARDFDEAVRVEGPHTLFAQKMNDLRLKYSRPWYLRDTHGNLNSAVADLDAFLSLAGKRGIKVYLFTNPFHEQYWELMRTEGHMPVYEDWMRSMEALAQKHRGDAVAFWDFALDSNYVHEPVPGAGVKSGALQWFWEPAHYRQQLGDLMIESMLSESCESHVVFGRRVL